LNFPPVPFTFVRPFTSVNFKLDKVIPLSLAANPDLRYVTNSSSPKLSTNIATVVLAFPALTSSIVKDDFSGTKLNWLTDSLTTNLSKADAVNGNALAIMVPTIATDVRAERILLFFITIFPFCLLSPADRCFFIYGSPVILNR